MKRYHTTLTGVLCLALFAAPFISSAQVLTERSFCNGIHAYEQKVLDRVTQRDTAAKEWRAQRKDRASTDAQRAAVATFVETVQAALDTRRAAVDAAINDFEDGAYLLWDEREADVASFVSDLEADIAALFDEAQTSCNDGMGQKEVREMVRAGIADLRGEHETAL